MAILNLFMRKILFVFALLLSSCLFAQNVETNSKVYFNLKSGVSIPLGDFSKGILNTGGFADPGFYAGFDAVWMAYDRIGLTLSADLAMNPIRVSDLGFERMQADPFLVDLWVRSDPFKLISSYGGITYSSELFDRININTGISLGLMYGETPYQILYSKYFMLGTNYYIITSAGSYGFAYKFDANIEYELRKQWTIFVNFGYQHSKLRFKFYSGSGDRFENKKIDLLNIAFGIRLKIF